MKCLVAMLLLSFCQFQVPSFGFAALQKGGKGIVRVLYFNYPPHIIITKQGPQGSAVDTWKRFAKKADLKIHWIGPVPYLRAQMMLERGEGDAIMPIAKTPDREKKFIYTEKAPIWGKQGLAVLKSEALHELTQPQDLKNKNISMVTAGLLPEFFATNRHLFNIQHSLIDTANLNMKLLLNKKIWGVFFVFSDVARYYAAKEHRLKDIKFIPYPGSNGFKYSYMALSRHADPEIIRRLNLAINQEAFHYDYEQLSQRYIEMAEKGQIEEDPLWSFLN